MISFLIKFSISFAISFFILNISINSKPLFYHISKIMPKNIQSNVQNTIVKGIDKTHQMGKELFTEESLPTKSDIVKSSQSVTTSYQKLKKKILKKRKLPEEKINSKHTKELDSLIERN